MNKIQQIISEIKKLEKELETEIEHMELQFFYKIKGKKVIFEEEIRNRQKKFVVTITSYLRNSSLLNLLTVPVIWLCLIPAVLMDASVSLYQMICFPAYGIPKVKRSQYIVID